jgi:hypothetical protein
MKLLILTYPWIARALAETQPGVASAFSPARGDAARIFSIGLAVGILVSCLLIGGLLIVNFGLFSKRREDQVGERAPSDLGVTEDKSHRVFPAMDTMSNEDDAILTARDRKVPIRHLDDDVVLVEDERPSVDNTGHEVQGEGPIDWRMAHRSRDGKSGRGAA